MTASDIRPAATVVVLRPAAGGGLETLLLQRSGSAGFMPDAWVFPGGVVDPADALVPSRGVVAGLAESRFAVAAVRECFEEAGIWLGGGEPPAGLREALQRGEATLLDAPGLVPDLSRVALWARWITPAVENRRYDTMFFVTVVDGTQSAREDRRETVSSRWVRPAEAVEMPHLDELFMAPPTFRTLEELSGCTSPDDVMALAEGRRVVPILPRRERYPGALVSVVLPGHETYPSDEPAPGRRRIALIDGRWRSLP